MFKVKKKEMDNANVSHNAARQQAENAVFGRQIRPD
jgi:hypothetical protein